MGYKGIVYGALAFFTLVGTPKLARATQLPMIPGGSLSAYDELF